MNLRRYGKYTLCALLLLGCARDHSDYVMKINEVALDKETFVAQFKVSPAYRGEDELTVDLFKKFIDETVLGRMLFEAEGYRLGIDNDSTVVARVEEEKRRQLIRPNGPLYRSVIPEDIEPVTEEIQALYQGQGVKVKFAHIWVHSRVQADSLYSLLARGADFGAVARRFSAEIATSKEGGVRNQYYTRGLFPAAVDAVLFNLQIGEISHPVATKFGYHILKMMDRTQNEVKPFEEAKENLRQSLIVRKRNEEVEEFVSTILEKNELRSVKQNIRYIFPMYTKNSLTENAQLDTSSMSRVYLNKILLEWNGGEMTVGGVAARYNRAMPAYQIPIHTAEDIIAFARNELLNDFLYREAIERKVDMDKEFVASISKYRDALVGQSCRRKLINERVKVSEDEIREKYASSDYYKGTEYDKVRATIENNLLREKSIQFADTITGELRAKYEIKYNNKIMESLEEELTRMRNSERGESDRK